MKEDPLVEAVEEIIKCPYGSWDVFGNWCPNPILKMTPQEQSDHNHKCGFSDEDHPECPIEFI